MTTPKKQESTRDEVLFAFQNECESPTAEQIIDWTRRYPQFADDIRIHAAIARDWSARKGVLADAPDENMLACAQSRVLNALYNAEAAANATPRSAASSSQTFQQLMAARGTDVPQLAREIGVARSVLADLVNGGMLAPVGKKLMDALASKLEIARENFCLALEFALASPRLGHAKADGAPTIVPRSYEEVVRDSNMSPERIAYWLSED